MIVYLVGGHGSGKSTLARWAMRGGAEPVTWGSRRYPVGYERERLFVLGHYEIPNGGADTVRPLDFLVNTVLSWSRDHDVLAEGIGQAGLCRRMLEIAQQRETRCLYLSTSLPECEAAVRARGHALSAAGVRAGHVRAANIAACTERAGVPTYWATRRTARDRLRELLRC